MSFEHKWEEINSYSIKEKGRRNDILDHQERIMYLLQKERDGGEDILDHKGWKSHFYSPSPLRKEKEKEKERKKKKEDED